MKLKNTAALLLLSLGFTSQVHALCDHSLEFCGYYKGGRSSPPGPASSSQGAGLGINPAAVPVERGFGFGSIAYKGVWDVAIVSGLGRVGAGISPANNEETFFGPPGLELPEEFELRKQTYTKYPGQKMTAAAAFNIYKEGHGLSRVELNLGILGLYNKISKGTNTGTGVSGILGPFTFGYSKYNDESVLDYKFYGIDLKEKYIYQVETYSGGIFFSILAVDYSVLRILSTIDPTTITMVTATLIVSRGMFTVSTRTEISDRYWYNYETKLAEYKREKKEVFYGAQFNITKNFLLGVYLNYYLLRELSAGATIFF